MQNRWRASAKGFETWDLMEHGTAVHISAQAHKYVGNMVAYAIARSVQPSRNHPRRFNSSDARTLLPPLLLGQAALNDTQCFLDRSLGALTRSTLGWKDTTEYTSRGFAKRGLVAYAPGALLRIAMGCRAVMSR